MRIFNKGKALLPALLLFSLLFSGCGTDTEELMVVFPKIGSADCAILMTRDATILIDTGEDGDGDEILALLEEYDRDSVDLLLISHYDKDHVGGADKILKSIPVKRIVGSTSPKGSEDYDEYQAALTEAGLTEEVFWEKTELTFGELSLTLYPPMQAEYGEEQSNNSSTAAAVFYGDTSFLFAGDAMETRTGELISQLEADGAPRFDLIKLPHHGREPENMERIIETAAKPGAAGIVTSSKKEPEAEELEDILPISVYLTRKGPVTAVSDGETVLVTQA